MLFQILNYMSVYTFFDVIKNKILTMKWTLFVSIEMERILFHNFHTYGIWVKQASLGQLLHYFENADDTGMFYGLKFYDDVLMEAGPDGNVQSEMILEKDMNTFTFQQGWAFPRKVYFNGDECVMPPPDSYPSLPNSANANLIASSTLSAFLLLLFLAFWQFNQDKCNLPQQVC